MRQKKPQHPRLLVCAMLLACCAAGAARADYLYLQNDTLRVGVDLLRGGAIGYLSKTSFSDNVVNVHDLGRYIQQSYYSGPDPYIPPGATQHPAYTGWGWNPVQAGDVYGYVSQVTDYSSETTLYVKCVPKQWALRNVDSECTMETWVTLDGNRVHVRNRLVNARSDTSRYGGRDQELPAVYTVGTLRHLFTYTGAAPFTGDALTEIVNSGPPWAYWSSTENWSAWVNDAGWGLGVFLPGACRTVGGFHGTPGVGGPLHANTGYLSPLQIDLLDHDIVYEYAYTLILGDLADIRGYACSHAPARVPNFVFAGDRAHCLPYNLTDGAPPYAGCWRLSLSQSDPQVWLPSGLWDAGEAPRILVTAAFRTTGDQAELFFAGTDGNFSADKRIALTIVPDGQRRTYVVDLSAHPLYTGAVTRLRFDPIQSRSPGDEVDLYGITTATPTAAPDVPAAGAGRLAIEPGRPNPFNPRTTLRYTLPGATQVTLAVYDERGRLVRTLVDARQAAGEQTVEWDGRDDRGRPAVSGTYLLRLVTERGVGAGKVSLVR